MKVSFTLEDLRKMNACKELLSFAEELADDKGVLTLDMSQPLAWVWLESNQRCWASFLRISPPESLANENLSYIDFQGANFHKVNLQGASFRGCNLSYADLSFANVYKANFVSCKLYRANFWHTEVSRAKYQDSANSLQNMFSHLRENEAIVNSSVVDGIL